MRQKRQRVYNKVDLADYVEVSDYLGIEVDTTTEDFQRIYNNILASDIRNYQIPMMLLKKMLNLTPRLI